MNRAIIIAALLMSAAFVYAAPWLHRPEHYVGRYSAISIVSGGLDQVWRLDTATGTICLLLRAKSLTGATDQDTSRACRED